MRGRWGEVQLKRLVELAGMQERCDFDTQETVTSDDGRQRPDMIVRLPGGKIVVVDAKVPLAAYLEALEATDTDARDALLAGHARQTADHLRKLGKKSYQNQFDATPQFVVMFIPGEAFFSAALQQDPSLIETGVKNNVIPASPTTLLALLHAVSYGWQQERIAASAREISQLGKDLFERIATFTGHLASVGRGLGSAMDNYNKAVGSFESRVLVSARRFKDLGVSGPDGEIELPSLDAQPRRLEAAESQNSTLDTEPTEET